MKMFSPTSLFFVVLLSTFSAFQGKAELASVGERIVGGLQARPEQFPYQASIRWMNPYPYPPYDYQLLCGGSIIHPRYILTAAQCVFDKNPMDLHVSVGSVLLEQGWFTPVNRIILRDPYFEPNGPNDIALLELMMFLEYTSEILPITLFGSTIEPDVLNATGWGWPIFSGSVSPALQYITVETISNAECAQSWGDRIGSDKMCTRVSGGRGTCGRDMGGPLVFYGIQIGIVGGGDENCDGNAPNVHTRVAPYVNWITNIISGRIMGHCSEILPYSERQAEEGKSKSAQGHLLN